MRIAVDVDLTVCAIDKLWLQWLNAIHHKNLSLSELKTNEMCELDYDLGSYFDDLPEPYSGYSPYDFFRRSGIYDFAEVVHGSIQALKYAKNKGHEIIFISHVKGDHHKSKYYWLKRNFPFMDGFIATKEKQYVAADMLIDDRHEHLNSFNGKYTNTLFQTPYTQSTSLSTDVYAMFEWSNFSQILAEIEN